MRKSSRRSFVSRAQSALKIVATALLVLVPSCDPGQLIERPVLPFGMSEELVVLVRNGPTTRFIGADGKYTGIEQDLAELFARDVGKSLRMVERNRFADILPALRRQVAHLAAAGLSVTEERSRHFDFGPAYLSV